MTPTGRISAEQLVHSLRHRGVTLPAEIGTFVILEACEELLRRGPCVLSLARVHLTEDGHVVLDAAEAWADDETCARGLHRDLTTLLVAAGPAPAPALMRLVEEGPRGGRWTLRQLRDDLEAALVPLNREASRRVLARLCRDVAREARPSWRPGPLPTFSELDSQLSSFLGDPEPRAAPPKPSARDRDLTVRDVVEEVDPSHDEVLFFDTPAQAPGPEDAESPEPRPASVPKGPASLPPTRVASQARARPAAPAAAIETHPPRSSLRPPPSRGGLLALLLLILAGGLLAATFVLRPELLGRLPGVAEPVAPAEPSPASERAAPKPAPVRAGDLVIKVSPPRAQVFRFVGRGPAVVPHVPRGVAQEFVAIADGRMPTRAVVPHDAEWEDTPEGPRFELAMQLGGRAPAGREAELLGDSALPEEIGAPRGGLGSVRIVTTPRGAKVFQLIGFAPEARVENLPLDAAVELLVHAPGHAPAFQVIAPDDFVESPRGMSAEVSFTLSPLKKR